jgi:hypothetical protein
VIAFDFSFANVDFAAARSVGYEAAIGYLSPDAAKNWTPGRVKLAHAAGLGIAAAWESTANRAAQGERAGFSDAMQANEQAKALGYPGPIFFAVDGDIPWSAVAPYFAQVVNALGRRAGIYGSLGVVSAAAAHGVAWRWQTEAWSGGAVSAAAHLYQRVTPTVTIPGAHPGSYDQDDVLQPVPFWRVGTASDPVLETGHLASSAAALVGGRYAGPLRPGDLVATRSPGGTYRLARYVELPVPRLALLPTRPIP